MPLVMGTYMNQTCVLLCGCTRTLLQVSPPLRTCLQRACLEQEEGLGHKSRTSGGRTHVRLKGVAGGPASVNTTWAHAALQPLHYSALHGACPAVGQCRVHDLTRKLPPCALQDMLADPLTYVMLRPGFGAATTLPSTSSGEHLGKVDKRETQMNRLWRMVKTQTGRHWHVSHVVLIIKVRLVVWAGCGTRESCSIGCPPIPGWKLQS
jgi:hypothetical protein